MTQGSTYEPGLLSSLLNGSRASTQTGGDARSVAPSLFSEKAQTRFQATSSLPGEAEPLQSTRSSGEAATSGETTAVKLTKKGKVRPPRPLKHEREATTGARKRAVEQVELSGGTHMPISEQEEISETSSLSGPKKAKKRPRVDVSVTSRRAAAAPEKRSEDEAPTQSELAELDEDEITSEREIEDRRDTKHDQEDSELKDKRTVFVGNLPNSINKKRLMTIFKPYGEIESVRFRSMALAGTKVDEHGNQRLVKKVSANKRLLSDAKDTFNAYVVFKSIDSVTAALAANNSVYEGKHLRVDRVGDESAHDHKRSVFVGNLAFDASEEEVRERFEKALGAGGQGGTSVVEAVRVVRDAETQQGRGFGFVLLKTRMAVAQALKLHGADFKGRPLRVTTCGKRTRGKRGEDARAPLDALKKLKKQGDVGAAAISNKNKAETRIKLKRMHSAATEKRPSFEGRRASEAVSRKVKKRDQSKPAIRLKKRNPAAAKKTKT